MIQKPQRSRAGQGALEYLLLIGGAVLVATLIMVIALGGIFPASNGIVQNNLGTYNSQIGLNTAFGGGGGGGGSLCVGGAPDGTKSGAEQCDTADFGGQTCDNFTGPGSTGSLSCTGNCTIISSSCVAAGGGGAPTISLSGSSAGVADWGQLNAVYSFTGSPTSADLCYGVASLGSVSSTTLATFQTQCTSAGGTNLSVPLAGPQLLTGLNGNAAYNLAMIACNGSGCTVNNTASGTSSSMASFASFTWATMSAQMKNNGGNVRANGWTLTNSAASAVSLSGFTPTFTVGTGGAATAVQTLGVGACNDPGISVASGVPHAFTSGPCALASGSSGGTLLYDAGIHGDGSQEHLDFAFADGSSFTTGPTLHEAVALEQSDATTCDPTPTGVATIHNAQDLGGSADHGYTTHFAIPSVSGTFVFASLEMYVPALLGPTSQSLRYEVLPSSGPVTCSGSVIHLDSVADTGNEGPALTMVTAPITASTYETWDAAPLITANGGVGTPDLYLLLSGDYSAGGTNEFRTRSRTGVNPPYFLVGYQN